MTARSPHLIETRRGVGAVASVIQSGLFWVIAVSALSLGIDRFTTGGLGALAVESPRLFLLLCGAFVLIALLGLAITPAEKALLSKHAPGAADFGAAVATLGHMGTIAFFSWWAFFGAGGAPQVTSEFANHIAPIRWGVMFELVFVGTWVWIIAGVGARHRILPRGFLVLSVVKATCFWFTFLAFLVNSSWMLVGGLGATALLAGPAWHLWVARLFPSEEESRG